jgi:DNA-binding CsgD family transcriptional regulator
MTRSGGAGWCLCDCCDTHLTRREIDVLLLITAELESAEISARLRISVRTVETHVASMLRKVGARNRAGLITHCYASGVLLPGTFPPRWSGQLCVRLSRDACSEPPAPVRPRRIQARLR